MLSADEMTRAAIQNQSFILAEELRKGIPLNYVDDQGRNVLEFPDGYIQYTGAIITDIEELRVMSLCHPN